MRQYYDRSLIASLGKWTLFVIWATSYIVAQEQEPTKPERKKIQAAVVGIKLRNDGKFTVDEKTLDAKQLQVVLAEKGKITGHISIQLHVDGNVKPGQLSRALNTILDSKAHLAELGIYLERAGPKGDDRRLHTGQQMLIAEAMAAVSQWRYTPTLLDGKAIAVIATVTVNFTLR